MSTDYVDGLIFPVVFLFAGVTFYFMGFKDFRRKRLIENIPTSKIRSMAMGLVELKGWAVIWHPLKGPFTLDECAYYKWQVEQYHQRGKDSTWEVVLKGDSSSVPFYIQDDTGMALVRPKNAETSFSTKYVISSDEFSNFPVHVEEFLSAQNYSVKALIGTKKLRFTEWNLKPGESAYVLGSCLSNSGNLMKDSRDRLQEAFRRLKDDPRAMAKFDANQDGNISQDEWEVARQSVEKELPPEKEVDSVYVGKDDLVGKILLISDKTESDLVNQFSSHSVLLIAFGILLVATSVYFALHYMSF